MDTQSPASIWGQVKSTIETQVPKHNFRLWLHPLGFKKLNQGRLTLSAPNGFVRQRVERYFQPLIERESAHLFGQPLTVSIEIESSDSTEPLPTMAGPKQLAFPQMNLKPHEGRMLRRDFTFDEFVVGGNNDFAYSASLSLATNDNSPQHSLFLLSKTGMGKSHLSQAVGHYILSRRPDKRLFYMTAQDFTDDMVRAYRHDGLTDFKKKYRDGCDMLLLEDVQYLSGKTRTQIELAHALDYLFESNKKVIFSGCYLPADIPKVDDQLKSRLGSGLISQIDAPDFRMRVRILKRKARRCGARISDDVLQYMAGELSQDVRQLESALSGLTARASLLAMPIDMELAADVLKNIAQKHELITIDVIKKVICQYYGVSRVDLLSRSRKQHIVRPRQIAMYLSRKYTDSPLQAIGKSFNRYHATALHSISSVEKLMQSDGSIKKQVEFLRQKIESGRF